jgi:DNA-binding NtrC family response regulator
MARRPFDLVITDVEMPGMRGTDLCAAILADHPTQLVILITAFGTIELAVSAVRTGAADFVAKPFKIEALVFAIERAFRDRQMRREIVRLKGAVTGSGRRRAGGQECPSCAGRWTWRGVPHGWIRRCC